MMDTVQIVIVLLTFFLAGLVKGVIGLGLPTISLAILTVAINLESAMALMLAPSLVTNLWQGFSGCNTRYLLSRLWPFLVATATVVFIGSLLFALTKQQWLSALLGLLIILYALSSMFGWCWQASTDVLTQASTKSYIKKDTTIALAAGALNGLLTGLTGSFVVPGVMYLQSLDFDKDRFVQAMGLLFSVSTVALAAALWLQHRLPQSLSLVSLLAVIPAMLGMPFGQKLARRLTEKKFKKLFFSALLLLGAYLIVTSI